VQDQTAAGHYAHPRGAQDSGTVPSLGRLATEATDVTVISPYSAADSPNTIPLFICAPIVSGFTVRTTQLSERFIVDVEPYRPERISMATNTSIPSTTQ